MTRRGVGATGEVMALTTVFDARTDLHGNASLVLLLMIPVAIVLVARRDRLPLPPWAALPVTLLLLLGAVLVPALALFGTFLQRRAVDAASGTPRQEVAEGPVRDLTRAVWRSRIRDQSFVVGGHRFAYACDVASPPAFRDCSDLIRTGLVVRITYVGDLILKVEIAK